MSDKPTLEYISLVTEINDLSEYMKDEKLDEALNLIIKLTLKPDIPAGAVAPVIVKARALAAELKLKGKWYMLVEKDSQKKNLYLSVAEEMVGLADSLKYLVRSSY